MGCKNCRLICIALRRLIFVPIAIVMFILGNCILIPIIFTIEVLMRCSIKAGVDEAVWLSGEMWKDFIVQSWDGRT